MVVEGRVEGRIEVRGEGSLNVVGQVWVSNRHEDDKLKIEGGNVVGCSR